MLNTHHYTLDLLGAREKLVRLVMPEATVPSEFALYREQKAEYASYKKM